MFIIQINVINLFVPIISVRGMTIDLEQTRGRLCTRSVIQRFVTFPEIGMLLVEIFSYETTPQS